MSLINSSGFVKSQNIKVFPCAYRGYVNTSTNEYKILNPEARTTTEYSFVNSYHKLSVKKESYVVSWTPGDDGASNGKLCFVIGGYYFEITDCSIEDFIPSDRTKKLSFYIKVDEGIKSEDEPNLSLKRLTSFVDSATWLDINFGTDDTNINNFYFSGLFASATNDYDLDTKLTPFIIFYRELKDVTIDQIAESRIDKKEIYYTTPTSPTTYIEVNSSNKNNLAENAILHEQVFDINPAAFPITNLLDTSTGRYSLRMMEDIEDGINNSTVASGNYSVALGKRTVASGLASTTLGKETKAEGDTALATGYNTTASGDYSFTGGNGSKATGTNALAFGFNTESHGANSLTVGTGTRTTTTGTNAVALGNSTIASGENSVAIGYRNTSLDSNSGAAGQNSVAIGEHTYAEGRNTIAAGGYTKATGNYAVAIGNNTEASGESAFAGGSSTIASAKNAVAVGQNTKATGENQVVIGKHNQEDSNKAFIIANGTSSTDTTANKFTVAYNGDTITKGTLTAAGDAYFNSNVYVKGSIVADKDAIENKLTLGSSDPSANGACGALSIYGTGSTEVFTVTSTGKTTIADTTEATASDGALKVAGGVRIDKKLNVGNNTEIAGNLNLTGNITAYKSNTMNTLTLGTNHATNNSSGSITVYGTGTDAVFTVANTGNTNIAGKVAITDATDATSDDGALKVTGGVKISKNLLVTTTANIDGDTSIVKDASNNYILNIKKTPGTTETNITVNGTLKTTGNATFTSPVNITNTTASTSTTTGALVIAGGIGVTGHVYTGSGLTVVKDSTAKFNVNDDGDISAVKLKLNGGITSSSANLQVVGDTEITGSLKAKSLDLSTANETSAGILKAPTIRTTSISVFEDSNYGTAVITLSEDGTIEAGDIYATNLELSGNAEITGTIEALDTTNKHKIGAVEITNSNLATSGTITAQVFNATSDLRKKTNIKDYKCEKSILDLPIKSFEYINDETHTNYIGCIAQDLQEICPELVNKDSEGYLSIQESKLVYLLLQEVKTLKEKVELLERR